MPQRNRLQQQLQIKLIKPLQLLIKIVSLQLKIRLISLFIRLINWLTSFIFKVFNFPYRKYAYISVISWQNGFVYRLNVIMWRFRMVIQTLTMYFLWAAVTRDTPFIGSYTQSEILTYILFASIIKAIVFSSRSIDAQGEIATGDLNNHLIKPLNYFAYWISRDISDKLLNIVFSLVEITVILFLLNPPVIIQTSITQLFLFFTSIAFATVLYFIFSFTISMTTFWFNQHNGWAQRFLAFVLLQSIGGGLFPLDLVSPQITKILLALPTAYFFYFPMQIYLNRLTSDAILNGFVMQLLWTGFFFILARYLWRQGLKVYGAYGR